MAVVSVKEIWFGRTGHATEKGERNYTRLFQVITDSPLDGPQVAGDAVDPHTGVFIPGRFDRYVAGNDIDPGSRVVDVVPTQSAESPKVWTVSVEYSTKHDPKDDDPLNRPTEISFGFAQFARVCDRDINGKGVLNSAGQYFDPPIEVDDSRPVITMARNESVFSAGVAMDYQDAVNSAAWYGFAANLVKLASISAQQQHEDDRTFWAVTYEFHVRREGWTLYVLDQGRKDITGATISTDDPVLLDGAGHKLANPTPNNAVFLPFNVYKLRDLNALGLP